MNTGKEQSKTLELQRKLRERAAELLQRAEKTSLDALETVIQVRMDTYFTQEGRLEEVQSVLAQIAAEIEDVRDLSGLRRISDRLLFLEDLLEEIDSILYERPARPSRRRFNISDFFRQTQSEPASPGGEIRSSVEAYRELGLDENSGVREIKRTFRRIIKELHPDQNNGDRRHEPRMRRLVAAYEYLIRRR